MSCGLLVCGKKINVGGELGMGSVMNLASKSLGVGLVSVLLSSIGFSAFAASLMVPVNRSQIVDVPSAMGEVVVASPDIADVVVHGKNKLSVIGKKIGRTSVSVFDESHKVVRNLDVVVGYDLPAIRKALKEFLPYEMVSVEMINNNVALTGDVTSSSAAAKAVKIVDEFVGSSGDSAAPSAAGAAATPAAGGSKVINLMNITNGQQVMLRVRVGEVGRTTIRNLGVNLQAITQGASSGFLLGTGGTAAAGILPSITSYNEAASSYQAALAAAAETGGVPTSLPPTPAQNIWSGNPGVSEVGRQGLFGGSYINKSGNGISGMLDALERDGLYKALAEPNLVAMSGEEAKFLAGGEFPIPVSNDDNQITIEFKAFGVSVGFKPYVINENRIRISVEPEVSELSDEGAIKIGALTIPGIKTRRAKTTVELAPGEGFMIAGLMKDDMKSSVDGLPGINEVPILSSLFRSTAYQRGETELVISVTPYLVDPMLSSDIKLPTDEFRPASAMEQFFYGALGSLSDHSDRIARTPSVEGPIGFMVD